MDKAVAERLIGHGSGVIYPSLAHPGMLESGMLLEVKERLDGGFVGVISADSPPKGLVNVEVPLERMNPSGWGEHALWGMK